MIDCDAAREMLLEADPAELKGQGESDFARHLRTCAACRQRTAFILSETTALGRALSALPPAPDAVDRRPADRGPRARRWRIAIPLALAAGVGALLLARRPQMPLPTSNAPLQVATANQRTLDVQVPAGQSVAVFHTDNPKIVVIWSY
jgi:ferric-dicitrate binding protein FerR (iron transport regulator)